MRGIAVYPVKINKVVHVHGLVFAAGVFVCVNKANRRLAGVGFSLAAADELDQLAQDGKLEFEFDGIHNAFQ